MWGYWIISENHACDHLRVRLRLITAPSDCNFQDFWTSFFEHRVIKWRRYTISVYHKMPNVIQWNVSLKQVTLELWSSNIHLSPYESNITFVRYPPQLSGWRGRHLWAPSSGVTPQMLFFALHKKRLKFKLLGLAHVQLYVQSMKVNWN